MTETLRHWLALSRAPFFTPALLPFLLGSIMATQSIDTFNWTIQLVALAALLCILMACHLTGEIDDLEVDRLSAEMERNRFSGGSQILVKELIPIHQVRVISIATIFLAVILGLYLQFVLDAPPLTIPLGTIGIFCAWFYSRPPLRLAGRGVGELMIAFCYGWLPIATAFYLQTGLFSTEIILIAIPTGLSCFNIILINEFPDYPADKQTGKNNLVVRFGKAFGRKLYLAATVLSTVVIALLYQQQIITALGAVFYLPFLIMALKASASIYRQEDTEPKTLEQLCGTTILINIGTALTLIVGRLG